MKTRQKLPTGEAQAIGYLRVSTAEQGESGAGLDAQRAAITAHAAGSPVEWVTEVCSAGKARPILTKVLARLDAQQGGVLIVSKIDRMARSVIEGAEIIRRAQANGWTLVIGDLGIDLGTAQGRMIGQIFLAVAEFERELIRQRTRDALAALKAAGMTLGRPSARDPEIVARIAQERAQGRTLRAIGDGLEADNVPTPAGGKWAPARVREVLLSAQRVAS